jgi:DNA adenine methylase
LRYLGGKHRLKGKLCPLIDRVRKPGQPAWDAFCGGLAMSEGLSKRGPVIASDACAPLISLYRAIAAGWQPPETVTKEQWESAKTLPDSDPLKAFCGFGCSFGAMWFSSYAPPEAHLTIKSGPSAGKSFTRKYHAATGEVLARQVPKIAAFAHADFLSVAPREWPGIIYCDPPYAGTIPYAGAPPFDSARFLLRVAAWAQFADVFVSEYSFPIGNLVHEAPAPRGCTMAKKNAIERLYHLPKGSKF